MLPGDRLSCWAGGIQPVTHPTDTSPREKGVSHYGIQDSQPLGKGVTTTIPVLLAQVLPLLCPAWGRLVIHVHSWRVHSTEHSFEEKESLFQLLKSNCGIASVLQKVAEWVPALSDFELCPFFQSHAAELLWGLSQSPGTLTKFFPNICWSPALSPKPSWTPSKGGSFLLLPNS